MSFEWCHGGVRMRIARDGVDCFGIVASRRRRIRRAQFIAGRRVRFGAHRLDFGEHDRSDVKI